MKSQFASTFICALLAGAALPVHATQLVSADFSGGINFVSSTLGVGLGLQRTNTCSGCVAGSVTGNLIYDLDQTPGAGSGYVNVPLNAVAGSSATAVFDIQLGAAPLEFKFDDANIQGGPSIQFHNGVFNGVFFAENFIYNATPYQISLQGGAWTLYGQNGSGFYLTNVASGYLNIGNANLTNQQPVTPVPLPATLPLLGSALAGLGLWRNRRISAAS